MKVLASIKSRVKSHLAARGRLKPESEVLRYLMNEVSDLRIIVRSLLAEVSVDKADRAQTRESFSYQWGELTEGKHLIGDPQFEREMFELATKYTDFPAEWFAGKTVLDAGCGNGRWSYVFAKLGAKVTAVDQSPTGVAAVQARLGDKYGFEVRQANLLESLSFKPEFDLVWCYGVAHHTGDTRFVVENVAARVKPGGRIFLMIYGEPSDGIEFNEINHYVELRRDTQFMDFEERRAYLEARFPKHLVHGYFDAISPKINDLHRFDEIEGWLRDLGFRNIRRTLLSRNHHMVADLPAA